MGLPYRLTLLLVSTGHYKNPGVNVTGLGMNMDSMMKILEKEVSATLPSRSDSAIVLSVSFQAQVIDVGTGLTINSGRNNQKLFLLPREVYVRMRLTHREHTRDDFENHLLNIYHQQILTISIAGLCNSTFKTLFLSDYSHNNGSNTTYNSNTSVIKQPRGLYEAFSNLSKTIQFSSGSTYVPRSDFIEMHPYLRCPHVKLSVNDVQIQQTIRNWPIRHVTEIEISFGRANKKAVITDTFEINQVYQKGDGEFFVCVGLLDSKFKNQMEEFKLRPARTNSLIEIVQYILTIVCVPASMFCLAATIVTYCLFPSLRTVPGCNTLGLSCSILVAQTLLMVANVVRPPSVLCTVLGVFTHYSWLVMFAWTFLCCLHMLRVFTAHHVRASSRSKRHERKAIALNVATSLVVPAFVVAVVVVTNVVLYDATRIGYGHGACTVDNVFAIHGPLLFVTICNIVFFTIVVSKIWNIRRLQSNDESRKDFVIYVKLSTLTGMFWLLVILGEVFENNVIRSLAVLANGSQGVFVFASYAFNRKVLELYADKFNLSCVPSRETMSTTAVDSIFTTRVDETISERPTTSKKYVDCKEADDR